MDKGSDWEKITLKDSSGKQVKISIGLSVSALTIKPEDKLVYNTTYTVTTPAGAEKSTTGDSMSSDYIFSFTTAKEPEMSKELEKPKVPEKPGRV